MLTAEGVTSYFVAARDQESGDDYYGLLSMAELILSFTRRPLPREEYQNYMRSLLPETLDSPRDQAVREWEDNLDQTMATVELTVVRFAGGEPAGANGILELFKDGSEMNHVFGRRGLVFIPARRRLRALHNVHAFASSPH
jgi:hypothetical protein